MRVAAIASSGAKALATVVLGTVLVSLVGERLAAYYSDRTAAVELKDQVGEQVVTLASEEAEGLIVLSSDLSPHSYLASRCRAKPPQLPRALAPYRETCHDAAVESLVEEQQRNLDVRSIHLKEQVLGLRMLSTLQDSTAADRHSRLLGALQALRKLNSATTCGPARDRTVVAFDSYDWMTADIRTQLVGPPAAAPCDDHSAEYPAAAQQVAEGLAFEGDVVRAEILQSSVRGRMDSRSELVSSLATDPFLWALLAVGALALLVLYLISRQHAHWDPEPADQSGSPG